MKLDSTNPKNICFRFSRTGKIVPNRWTYPQTEAFDGAQVWSYGKYGSARGRGGDIGCVMMKNGKHPQWDDGFSYGPEKYSQIQMFEVEDYSGESGPLKWKAIEPVDVRRAWITEYEGAKAKIKEWVSEHRKNLTFMPETLPPNRTWCKIDEWEPFHPAKVLARLLFSDAQQFSPQWKDTLSKGLINS